VLAEKEQMVAVPESLKRLEQWPWVAHMIRTVERYTSRLGSQFAAATTYFSVLALVPVLMMAFSVIGFVLTVVQPELLDNVADTVVKTLGSAEPATRDKIVNLVNQALSQYWAIGLVGLVAALYTGAKWMGHLKNAVRTQWRPGFDLRPQKINIVVKTVGNLVLLLGLLVGMAVTFGLASLSTSLADTVVSWLGLSDQPWISPLLRVTSVVLSIGAGWLIFMYLYTVLPETREPWPIVRRGALLGSIALAAVQFLASFLISAFRGNPAAAIFGPVIVLMLFFNIFAQLVLFIAAWIATAEHEAVPAPADERLSSPEDEMSPAESELNTKPTAEPQQRPEDEPNLIPQAVAGRSVRAGLGAGYITGAATGVGLGAALAYVFSAAVRGRKKTT
jgi:membrane protein